MTPAREAKNRFIQTLASQTRVLNAEIKQEIVRQKAVDTGRMKNNTKVKVKWTEQKWTVTIEDLKTTDYYKYVDKGFSRKWKGGKTRRNLTDAFVDRPKSEQAILKIMESQAEWLILQQFEVNGL
jgi:hypothetical protein